MTRALARFVADDRGTTVLETLVVFIPVMSLFYANVEVIFAFNAVNAAEKAAQAASRIAATSSPIYVGPTFNDTAADRPLPNQLAVGFVDSNPACFQPTGTPACVVPDDDPWVCDGATISADANCNAARFGALMFELQRFYPSVECEDVSVRYIYRQLGFANGPMVPEIQVRVAPREMPVDLLGVMGYATLGSDEPGGQTTILGAAVSSSLGEDLEGVPDASLPPSPC